MTTAEIKALVEEVRRDAHEIIPTRMQGVTRRLCAAITDLLARDNIRTFAEQEARIAELEEFIGHDDGLNFEGMRNLAATYAQENRDLRAELARVKAESLRVVPMTEDRSPLNMDTVVRHATIDGRVVRLERWEVSE